MHGGRIRIVHGIVAGDVGERFIHDHHNGRQPIELSGLGGICHGAQGRGARAQLYGALVGEPFRRSGLDFLRPLQKAQKRSLVFIRIEAAPHVDRAVQVSLDVGCKEPGA